MTVSSSPGICLTQLVVGDMGVRVFRQTQLHHILGVGQQLQAIRAQVAQKAAMEDNFAPDGHWNMRLADWGDPERALEGSLFLAILQRCLDALPPRLARLFMLREVMEESTEIICQELSITPANRNRYTQRFG